MSRVFVVAEAVKSKFNVDGLRQFGEIVYLYSEHERKPTVYNGNAFASSLVARLNDAGFDPQVDYVAMVGRQIEVGYLFYIMGLLAGDIRILFFDAQKAEYSETLLNANEIPDLQCA